MACYHLLTAFRTSAGDIVFQDRGKIHEELKLPCGQCFGCRLERSRQWAMRCLHESSLHRENCFVTLTYDDANLPEDRSLHYKHFQDFMKRLRKKYKGISFYMCGEYGEQLGRPHFHACLFNMNFRDRVYHSKTKTGSVLYRSPTLEALWPYGFSSIGEVNFESAAYVARYVMKKINGDLQEEYYLWVDQDSGECFHRAPEFNHMSLKPAIGKRWLEKFTTDVYPRDYAVINGKKVRPPKYYDRLFEKFDPDAWREIVLDREDSITLGMLADRSLARMEVREKVAKARVNRFSRDLK